jgi:hypothetical protein
MRIRHPLKYLWSRAAAAVWTRRGRRSLARSDVQEGIAALEKALLWHPFSFPALLHLSRAYLRIRDLYRAHRTLARARECDPVRFAREASSWISREGFDVEAVCHGPPPVRTPERVVLGSERRPRTPARHLAFGDCRDLDEYARFQAMPPISAAEVEETDWDHLLGDLQDD